jgi:hypothetical protein
LNWILLIWEGAAFEEDGNIFEIKIVLKILIKIIDYKIMLKLQCKTTFNPVFVGKKIIKIEQESWNI